MPGVVTLGVILMRGFAGLFAYLAGVSAVVGFGIVGLMALQAPTERIPFSPVAATETRQAGQAAVDDKKDGASQSDAQEGACNA
jgi:hypothetical protein